MLQGGSFRRWPPLVLDRGLDVHRDRLRGLGRGRAVYLPDRTWAGFLARDVGHCQCRPARCGWFSNRSWFRGLGAMRDRVGGGGAARGRFGMGRDPHHPAGKNWLGRGGNAVWMVDRRYDGTSLDRTIDRARSPVWRHTMAAVRG